VAWFTYWSLFGWMITGVWLLWIEGSAVLDCAALARFLLNDSPYAPLLQLTFYLVPPILVQLVCTVARVRAARAGGEQWMLPVSMKHAFWHEPVTIWPILCLWAGVSSLALFNQVALGLACLRLRTPPTWYWSGSGYVCRSSALRASARRFAHPHSGNGSESRRHAEGDLPVAAAEGRLSSPYMIAGGD